MALPCPGYIPARTPNAGTLPCLAGPALPALFPLETGPSFPTVTPVREAFLVPDAAKHPRDKGGLRVFVSTPRSPAHLRRHPPLLRPGGRPPPTAPPGPLR